MSYILLHATVTVMKNVSSQEVTASKSTVRRYQNFLENDTVMDNKYGGFRLLLGVMQKDQCLKKK